MASMLEKIVATLKPGYTITPITMIRAEGTEPCIDARPCYGPDGKWLNESERGPKCPHQHVEVLDCERSHKHTYSCRKKRVHVNVEVPGHLVVSADGKFQAKVFDGAEAPRTGWNNPNIVAVPRRPKLKPEGLPPPSLPGVEVSHA